MADHPLTDADCKQIQKNTHDIIHPYISYGSSDYGEDPTLLDDLIRAGYDKGAADTLERVIEWLKHEIEGDLNHDPYLLLDLKEAMRPQQQQEES